MESSSQIRELHGVDIEYAPQISLTAPVITTDLVSSVDITNTGSSSKECDRILDVPRVIETTVGTLASANDGTSYGVPDVLIDPSMEQQQSCHDTRHDSAYTGMFSVEQHFVCLVCCRPTCFKTDAALVVHLRVHISEQTIKVKKQSEETPDIQMDEIQENPGENSKVPIVIDSDSDTNTETVCNNSMKTDDRISSPIELCLFDSKDENSILLSTNVMTNSSVHSTDVNNVLANNTTCMSDLILNEKAMITDCFGGSKIIPMVASKNMHQNDFRDDLEENAAKDDINMKAVSESVNDSKSYNVLSMIPQHSIKVESDITDYSDSDFLTDSEDCVTPGSIEANNGNDQRSTKERDKVIQMLAHRINDPSIFSDIKPRIISDYVCTQCQSHFKNYLDLMLHLKVHQPKKEIDRIGVSGITKATTRSKDINDAVIFTTKQVHNNAVRSTNIKSKRGKTATVAKSTKPRNIKRNLSSESNKPCVCEICGKIFSKRKDCSSHIKRVHGSKLHACDKCGKAFTFPEQLREHLNIHSGTREFLCHLCPKSFLARQNLKKHLQMHSGVRPHHCTECSYQATTKHNLVKHMWTHSNETHASCSICNKNFKRLSSLRYHMTIHTGERLHKCDVCNKQFQFPIHLAKHKKCKHNSTENVVSKPFSCTQCNKSYAQRYGLKLHQQSQHMSMEKPYACSSCSVKCTSRYELKRHTMRVHSKIKPFTCTICGKGYLYGVQIINHMKTHSIEDPQSCFLCKQYFSEGELSSHVRTHEKRYCCTECEESFYVQSDLTEHLKIHFGDKPHICHVCKQRFDIVAQLLIHKRQHREHAD